MLSKIASRYRSAHLDAQNIPRGGFVSRFYVFYVFRVAGCELRAGKERHRVWCDSKTVRRVA